jgi:hypothetical protein
MYSRDEMRFPDAARAATDAPPPIVFAGPSEQAAGAAPTPPRLPPSEPAGWAEVTRGRTPFPLDAIEID